MSEMTPAQLKKQVQGLFAAYNSGAIFKEIDKWYAADVVSHYYDGRTVRGLGEFKKNMEATMAAFANAHLTLDDIVVQGDREAHSYSYTATFSAPFLDIKPTGKKITVPGNVVFQTWRDGKIAEIWWMDNALAMSREMGVVPPQPK